MKDKGNPHDQEIIEKYLTNQTKYCTIYRARISAKQCRLLQARTRRAYRESRNMLINSEKRQWKQEGFGAYRLRASCHMAESGVWCLRCETYQSGLNDKSVINLPLKKGWGRFSYGRKSHISGAPSR